MSLQTDFLLFISEPRTLREIQEYLDIYKPEEVPETLAKIFKGHESCIKIVFSVPDPEEYRTPRKAEDYNSPSFSV